MTQLLDLIRLYVQSAGVQNAIDSGPGREPWTGQPEAGPTATSEWGTVDPAFRADLPSNCTLTRYANGDVLVTPTAGALVMRVTCQARDSQYGDYASVRYTARMDLTKNQVGQVSWINYTLQRPGSVLVGGSAGAAPANPAGSTEAAYQANSGAPIAQLATDTPALTAVLTFTRQPGQTLAPVILRAGTKIYVGPKVMVETPILRGPVQQITGDVISIVAQRGLSLTGASDQLDPGILKAVVKGAAYEPGVNTALRPGSAVWLVARRTNVGLDTSNGPGSPGPARWQCVWSGKVLNGDVDYEGDEPRVTIEATDYVAELANIPAPIAWGRYNPITGGDAGGVVSASQRMQRLLWAYTARTYWSMLDTASGSPGDGNAQQQDKDDSASLLQQLQRVRDTSRGWLWMDAGTLGLRNNGAGIVSRAPEFQPTLSLRFNAGNSPLTNVPRYLATDNPAEAGLKYVGLKTSYSSRALCNAITLKVHTANSDTTYGPYTNQDSLTQWGAQSDEVELHELEGWNIFGAVADPGSAANAGSFLKRYATPQRYPSSVTLNVTADVSPALDSQPYDALRVKRNAPVGALDSTVRVLKLTHTITADRKRPEKGRWLLQLDTRPIEGTAAVPVTPPDATASPNGQTAGGGSVEAVQPYTRLARRGADYTFGFVAGNNGLGIPNTVFWDTFLESAGIQYDGTNRWFIIPKPGRYLLQFNIALVIPAGQPAAYMYGVPLVNGVEKGRRYMYYPENGLRSIQVSQVIKCAANDHVQAGFGTLTNATYSFSSSSGVASPDDRASCTITYLGG